MGYNGPAISGGCVTRRNSGRPLVPVPTRRSNSAGKGGYGVVFAIRVQILLSITRVAVQFVSEPENCQGAGFILRADARVRV